MKDATEKQFNITTDQKELTIREGKAIDPREAAQKSISISGTLAAPFDFLVGKPGMAKDTEAIHLKIDNQSGSLTLVVNDQHPYTTHTIIGSLSEFAELAPFRINSDSRWQVKDFKKFLRTVKVHFADRGEVDALLESLNKWEAKIETVIKQHNDNSGNSLTMLEQSVNNVQLKRKFTLLMPIYKGYGAQKFEVEICTEPKNTEVQIYLVSDELYELKTLQRLTIMADELKKFDAYKFSKVVIS